MSQDEIMKIVNNQIGITQIEAIYTCRKKDISSASAAQQIISLRKKNKLARKPIKRTYELYPIVETSETIYCIIHNWRRPDV